MRWSCIRHINGDSYIRNGCNLSSPLTRLASWKSAAGSSQSFAERSDNAELRNEKGGESLVLFKERPASRRYAALQKIAEALWHVMAGSCEYDPTGTFAELAQKKAAAGRLNQLGHHLGFSKVWDRKMMHVGSWTTSLTVKEDWNEP